VLFLGRFDKLGILEVGIAGTVDVRGGFFP
jgi:hypothetical protein